MIAIIFMPVERSANRRASVPPPTVSVLIIKWRSAQLAEQVQQVGRNLFINSLLIGSAQRRADVPFISRT
jgi:hypothetical protein